jgi:hypothetical protein
VSRGARVFPALLWWQQRLPRSPLPRHRRTTMAVPPLHPSTTRATDARCPRPVPASARPSAGAARLDSRDCSRWGAVRLRVRDRSHRALEQSSRARASLVEIRNLQPLPRGAVVPPSARSRCPERDVLRRPSPSPAGSLDLCLFCSFTRLLTVQRR